MSAKCLVLLFLSAVFSSYVQNVASQSDNGVTFPDSLFEDDNNNTANNGTPENKTESATLSENYGNNDTTPNDGKADNLAEYFVKKLEELFDNTNEEDSTQETDSNLSTDAPGYETKEIPNYDDLRNCSLPATLDRFCDGIPEDVLQFFNYDLSISGFFAPLLKNDVIEALWTNCSPGNWCLPSIYHEEISQGKDDFYRAPYCSSRMEFCLENMKNARLDCKDEMLDFFVRTVDLLCAMEELGDLEQECYTRTVEAVAVTYADLTSPLGSRKSDLEKEGCNEFKNWMTTTISCVDDVCGYDQNRLLENFDPWVPISKSAAYTVLNCNISRTCQSDYDEDDEMSPYPVYDYFDDDYDEEGSDEEASDGEIQETSEIPKEDDVDEDSGYTEDNQGYYTTSEDDTDNDSINADTNTGYDNQNWPMMIGLVFITGSIIFAFACIACILYKRTKHNRDGNYKYAQLINEEGNALRKNYN